MRRTELKRSTKPIKRTALKRSTKPLKRSWIKAKPVDPEKKRKRDKDKREREKQSAFSPYWRERATLMWGKIIVKRSGGICEFTGEMVGEDGLDPHHVVHRGVHSCRTDLDNGMAIKTYDHISRADGPHGTDENLWHEWLTVNRPETEEYYQAHKSDKPVEKFDWKADCERLTEIYKGMV